VVGIDNAPAALDACRENLSKGGLQATILAGEMGDLSFPAGSFDGALSTFVIHHGYRADIEHIIGSITRLLAPAGLFVWVTPTPRHYQCGRGEEVEPGTWVDPNHPEGTTPHHYSTEDEIRELLAAYDIESMRERNHGEGDKIRWHWFILARRRAGQ
jgi:SAM-dependent methyltransferase